MKQDWLTIETVDGETVLTKCSQEAEGDIVIPEGVTSIGDHAFDRCCELVSVVIPEGVTTIGRFAFDHCTKLSSVVIPKSVRSVENDVFFHCPSLPVEDHLRYADTCLVEAVDKKQATYTIKDGTRFICSNAFCEAENMTSIVIPESVETIGLNAFAECAGLVSIKIPEHVNSIDNYAFFACKSLTSIEIPAGIECLGVAVFSICTSLDSIRVSPDNKVYDSRENCNAIIETASGALIAACRNTIIPAGVTAIEDDAFLFCDDLTSLVIPDGVTYIGYWAFAGCTSLRSVYIPDSVKEIDVFAFQGCFALKSLRLPDGVKVREFAFDDCISLSEESLERIDDLFESLAVKYGVE